MEGVFNPYLQAGRPVSFPMDKVFRFSLQEIRDGDFSRFRASFAAEIVREYRGGQELFGSTLFPLADLVKSGTISPYSEEFVAFCQLLRAEPGYVVATSLDSPDYALAIAMSLPKALIFHSGRLPLDIRIQAAPETIMMEFKNDEARALEYSSQAGLLQDYRAKNYWAKIRLYFIRSFWPS